MELDKLIIIAQIVLLIGTLSAFIIGVAKYFKKRKPLFLQIITSALGCAALGQISFLIKQLIGQENGSGFQVSVLGLVGCYFFFFSASFGQIDGLGDSKDKELRKYRLISLSAPLAIAASYYFVVVGNFEITETVINGILFALLAVTSYFNLKHLILPDVDGGILKSIRSYNLVVLMLSAVTILRQISELYGIEFLTFATMLCSAVLFFSVIIIAGRGVKKWFL